MTKKTAVYRHFDVEGRLLYVGISLDPLKRTTQHMNKAYWAERISAINIRWFPTRGAAVDEEERAIREEKPLCNVVGQPVDLGPEPEIDEAAEMAALERHISAISEMLTVLRS